MQRYFPFIYQIFMLFFCSKTKWFTFEVTFGSIPLRTEFDGVILLIVMYFYNWEFRAQCECVLTQKRYYCNSSNICICNAIVLYMLFWQTSNWFLAPGKPALAEPHKPRHCCLLHWQFNLHQKSFYDIWW